LSGVIVKITSISAVFERVALRHTVAAAVVLVAGLSMVSVAHAQNTSNNTSSSCSAAYHGALTALHTAQGDALGGAVGAMRASDPVLPGRWIYAQALFAKGLPKTKLLEETRPCLEKVKVAGRLRCARYDDAAEPPLPSELVITASPNAEELRVLKAVADLVEGRGAVPDVGPNGKYQWVAQRAAGDLKLYMSQPAHPALCSGGKDFAAFYGDVLKTLQKRMSDVGELGKKARALAVNRMAGMAVPDAKVAAAGTSADSAPPAAAAPAADNASKSLVMLVADAVRPILSADELASVSAEKSALAALQRAKPMLIAAQAAAGKVDDSQARERTQASVQAAGRAVRQLEAVAYTDIYAQRYQAFATTVLTMPQAIQDTHKRTCTCGE
jgi:hypothetical protein